MLDCNVPPFLGLRLMVPVHHSLNVLTSFPTIDLMVHAVHDWYMPS